MNQTDILMVGCVFCEGYAFFIQKCTSTYFKFALSTILLEISGRWSHMASHLDIFSFLIGPIETVDSQCDQLCLLYELVIFEVSLF